MNTPSRLAAALSLAALLLTTAPAGAASKPGSFGAFMAGEQALGELRTGDSVKFFRDAIAAESDNPVVLQRAFVAFATNGEIDLAANTAQKLLTFDPTNQMARVVVGTDALKQRRYPAAVSVLETLGADSFEAITGVIVKAWALTAQGKLDEAYAQLDVVSRGGLEDFLLFHRAVMASVAGKPDLAVEYITQAHDIDPLSPDVVEAYARILANADRFDEAKAAIATYEAQGLSHPLVEAVKADLDAGRRPTPLASTPQQGAAAMFYAIGIAFAREESNDVAMVFLRLGRYLDPSADLITFGIGQLYDGAGQHDAANILYETIPDNSPIKGMATVRIAGNLDAIGDRPEAISRLREIIGEHPDDLDAISVLGDLLRADKQYLPAADAYTQALATTGGTTPGDWRFYYVRGIAYERGGEWPKAEADFRRALELRPDQPSVLNYLGYSWVDQGMNLDEALKLIEKAVAASPRDGYIIDSLGWAYYRLGRYDEAVVELEKAAILKPTDPEINDHLGDAYWKVGRKLEAKFQWRVATAVDEEGDVKKRAAPKLANGLDAVPVTAESAPIVEQGAPERPAWTIF
ncbi:MAG: tetratricopeptide repeat protein [Devosia sp.]